MSILTNAKPDAAKLTSDKINFELTVTHIDDFEEMSYTTYGIRATYPSGEIAACYPDVSTSKEFVLEFLSLIGDNDVSAVHIGDLLEDFLV